ncbi:MAG: sigma factor-like helix-turn-helix DNA-binding protein [Oscillospiraceae bacterium]
MRRPALRGGAKALLALSGEDREIFYRFYDLAQTAAQIAEAMQMNASTVRSRLMREGKRFERAY